MIHPVLVGSGRRLVADAGGGTLRLADSVVTATGVVVLTYVRAD